MADGLESRTGQQCLHRWLKTSCPNIRKGPWSIKEDKVCPGAESALQYCLFSLVTLNGVLSFQRLAAAVHAYGKGKWAKVAKHLPG